MSRASFPGFRADSSGTQCARRSYDARRHRDLGDARPRNGTSEHAPSASAARFGLGCHMADIPDTAIAGLLQWAYNFSEELPTEQQIEMRMRVLEFVALGFPPRDPGFDLDEVAEGRRPPGAPERITLGAMIEAFRFYKDARDVRGATAAQIVWHLVGRMTVAALN